jgi:signal peptidase II
MSSQAIGIDNPVTKARYLIITALAIAFDQVTKYWVTQRLGEGGEIVVIKNFFVISYTENPGIAFGMLGNTNVKWALVAISVAAIFIVVYYLMHSPLSNRLLMWSLALLAGGIAGNLIDRVRLGRVIDFLEFFYRDWHFPVFNVADTVITIGASLMAIELLFAAPPKAPETTLESDAESDLIGSEQKSESSL